MVSAQSGMDFSQELSSFFFEDTSLKDSGSTFLIELSVVNLVGLRTPDNAAGLILVLRKLLPIKVGQEGFGPWGNDCHDERCTDGVISVAEPPMISLCLESRVVFGSGLVLSFSPCHTTAGLKSLSRKILGGTGSRLALMRARTSTA